MGHVFRSELQGSRGGRKIIPKQSRGTADKMGDAYRGAIDQGLTDRHDLFIVFVHGGQDLIGHERQDSRVIWGIFQGGLKHTQDSQTLIESAGRGLLQ